jgi:tRNA(Ile)-lysidine synthase
MADPARTLDSLLSRCTFPERGTAVDCAFSGGADSTALVTLAHASRCDVTAIHVDHGLRPSSAAEAERAASLASSIGVDFRLVTVEVPPGANVEARARDIRYAALPPGTMTGHTADDLAETMLINLLRGAGMSGLAGIRPGPTKPILALRRSETRGLCAEMGLSVVEDPTNRDRRFVRNRVRAEVLPLLDDIAGRDVTALLARTAELLATDADLLDELAGTLDPTDAKALAAADPRIARRSLRAWMVRDGYPPDLATVDRVLDVARGAARACDIGGGRRVERKAQRLRIVG